MSKSSHDRPNVGARNGRRVPKIFARRRSGVPEREVSEHPRAADLEQLQLAYLMAPG